MKVTVRIFQNDTEERWTESAVAGLVGQKLMYRTTKEPSLTKMTVTQAWIDDDRVMVELEADEVTP